MIRLIDLFFSLLAIAILSPLFVIVSIILKFTGEGEVFFFQERIGKENKKFKLFKFSTMLKNSESIGTGTITVKNDPRILPVGKLLRVTKINELPQLFNILLGDMSIIGPRPLTQDNFAYYNTETREIISLVRPGLSGIGSIVFRNEEEILTSLEDSVDFYKKVIAPYKGNLEVWFVSHNTVFNYFKLIMGTVDVILFPRKRRVWKLFKNLPSPPNELKEIL